MASANANWATEDKRRFLHAQINSTDAASLVSYYTKLFGMKLTRTATDSNGDVHHYVSYGPETAQFAIDFVQKKVPSEIDLGSGFGHFGVSLTDVYAAAGEPPFYYGNKPTYFCRTFLMESDGQLLWMNCICYYMLFYIQYNF